MDAKYPDRMLLAEANQWPEDAAAYFGDGDECHMGFHFPLMPRLFMALRLEHRFPIIDILEQTPPIPENGASGRIFLRNHDELTLEMVTDEERDYMYRVYANDPQTRINLGIRRRLAPLLGNDRREIELMNALLFSLPGTPVLYYGDEIGMGDNVYLGDRNGVRTPMQWSGDRNAGFSDANPQRLYFPVITDPEYHYETVNVEVQRDNPNSHVVVGQARSQLAQGDARAVAGWARIRPQREPEGPHLPPIARRAVGPGRRQSLPSHPTRRARPDGVRGGGAGRAVRSSPLPGDRRPSLLAHPRASRLLLVRPRSGGRRGSTSPAGLPRVTVRGELAGIFRAREQLDRVLLGAIEGKRWFRSKAQTISGGHIVDRVDVPGTDLDYRLPPGGVRGAGSRDLCLAHRPRDRVRGGEQIGRDPRIGDRRSPLPVGDRRALRRHHRTCIRHRPGRSRRQPSQAEGACHDAVCRCR